MHTAVAYFAIAAIYVYLGWAHIPKHNHRLEGDDKVDQPNHAINLNITDESTNA